MRTPDGSRAFAYQPALDGVRAVAVTMVLLFHGGVGWMSGGYVGVSVFFTLSGYLITALLLVEHQATGTIDLRAFWTRRVKRLLPASLLVLAVVVVASAAGAWRWDDALRRDVVGAALQVHNWVKLSGEAGYGDLVNATLGRVGPLEHYWSLSIEEQFYWVWPVVMLFVLRRARSASWVTVALVLLAAAGMVAAPVVAIVWGPDAAYWATPARAGEILLGAVVAAVLHRRPSVPTVAGVAAVVPAVIVVGVAMWWPSSSGPAYAGWLPVFAVASATLLWCLQVSGPVQWVLSRRPLVWLGTVSYGVYLFHWPLYAWLDATRTGLDGVSLLALRVGATLLVAALSARLIERPIRTRPGTGWRPVGVGLAATVAVTIAALLVVPASTPGWQASGGIDSAVAEAADIDPVEGSLAPLVAAPPSTSVPVTSVPVTSVPVVSRPVRIVVVGDSTAQSTAEGLVAWAADHPETAQVRPTATPGCGFLRDGRVPTDGTIDWAEPCRLLLDEQLPAVLAETHPDVVVLVVTMRDVENRVWSDEEGELSPFDRRYRDRLLDSYREMLRRLAEAGVPRVAWVLPPVPIAPFEGAQRVMRERARYEVQHGVIRQIAAESPQLVRVVDLDRWLVDVGRQLDTDLRPDGLHWSAPGSYWVSDSFLAASVVSVAVG